MAAPPSLEEFISSLPKTTADKGTLVRLYNQIGAVNKEDVDFLLLEKNRIHKCLIDAREKDEKQTSDWIDQMQNDTVILNNTHLTPVEQANVTEAINTFLLLELKKKKKKKYKNTSTTSKKCTFNALRRGAEAVKYGSQWMKDKQDEKFLRILMNMERDMSTTRDRYSYGQLFREERIRELEEFLEIEKDAAPTTSPYFNQPTAPKKRKHSGAN